MQRAIIKRGVVSAVAALALATAVPSVAAADEHKGPEPVTLDFTAHLPKDTAGREFGGEASATDRHGDLVGGAVVNCTDVPGKQGDTIFCNGIIKLENRGEIAFTAGELTSKVSGPEHEISGVITGGTDEFEGITGEIHVERESRGVFEVSFDTDQN